MSIVLLMLGALCVFGGVTVAVALWEQHRQR